MNNMKIEHKQLVVLTVVFLMLVTIFVYGPVHRYEFLNYDDNIYVTENIHVCNGLTRDNILWAFRSLDAGFWQPLTWLSLMMDYEIYRLNAGGYHLTNVMFHIAATLVLFLALVRMTGQAWPCALVAGLFALHPLNVEAVSWISSRKDVLSGFFWMCALLAYAYYVEVPRVYRYLLVMICFMLGLMSKAMVVTLPFVLILLDYWPLDRFSRVPLWKLAWEKVPFIVLSILMTVVTFYTEERAGALPTVQQFPLDIRVANAVMSYVLYIWKMIWPADLAIYYPHPGYWSLLWVLLAALLLIVLSVLAIRLRSSHKYIFVGWAWYLLTLIPVIGLVQVGSQAMADRYTYIPLIGLFICLSWGISDVMSEARYKNLIFGAISLLLLILCTLLAMRQISYWQDSTTLFRHAIASTESNYISHYNLGIALKDKGNYKEAVSEFNRALELKPESDACHNNLGIALILQGNFTAAEKAFRTALRLNPSHAGAHNNLGMVLYRQNKYETAKDHFLTAIKLRPDYANAHYHLALILGHERGSAQPLQESDSNQSCLRDCTISSSTI